MIRSVADFAEQRGELAQGEVGAPVRGHQQHPVLQRERPRPALADRIGPLAPRRCDQLVELPRAQPGETGLSTKAPTP
jgi:hypothetical protein